uniref:Uncharacterized protein n=1 Tax=Acrobeloides nanus TaxID=290746 RepID=A0A914CAB9_9BILA
MYEGELCEFHVTPTSTLPDLIIHEPSTSSERSVPYETEFEASPEETVYDPSEKFNEAGAYPSEYWEHSLNNHQLNEEQYLTVSNPYPDESTKHYSNRGRERENLIEEEDGWMMVKRSKGHNSASAFRISSISICIISLLARILLNTT